MFMVNVGEYTVRPMDGFWALQKVEICCDLKLWALNGTLSDLLGMHVSHEKYHGWLDCIGVCTTQLYRDYNKPL